MYLVDATAVPRWGFFLWYAGTRYALICLEHSAITVLHQVLSTVSTPTTNPIRQYSFCEYMYLLVPKYPGTSRNST